MNNNDNLTRILLLEKNTKTYEYECKGCFKECYRIKDDASFSAEELTKISAKLVTKLGADADIKVSCKNDEFIIRCDDEHAYEAMDALLNLFDEFGKTNSLKEIKGENYER